MTEGAAAMREKIENGGAPAKGVHKIASVAMLLFRELVRDKVFFTLLAAAVALVFGALILGEMVAGEKVKAVKDLGLSVVNIFSLFILIFSGVHLVAGDISRKTLYFIFARPVRRGHYLAGAAAAVLLTVFCAVLAVLGVLLLLLWLQGEVWLGGALISGYLTMLEMVIMLSFALLFAVSLSPQLAMFLTLLIYAAGHTAQKAALIVESSRNVVLKYLVLLLSGVLPNLEFFDKKPELVYGIPIPPVYLLHSALYALSYGALILLLAAYVLNKKEL